MGLAPIRKHVHVVIDRRTPEIQRRSAKRDSFAMHGQSFEAGMKGAKGQLKASIPNVKAMLLLANLQSSLP